MRQGLIRRQTKTFRSKYSLVAPALAAKQHLFRESSSERFFVLLCFGIDVEFFARHFKSAHFLQHTNILMPFLLYLFTRDTIFQNLSYHI